MAWSDAERLSVQRLMMEDLAASPATSQADPSSEEEDGITRESSWATAISLPKHEERPANVSANGLDASPRMSAEFLASPEAQTLAMKLGSVLHDANEVDSISRPPTKPLQLLDLPIDILETIVREIASTNDLTSLALSHSVLHAIVIPQMYSRFDIVWPDPGDEGELRIGVDALAFGLGTLAMSGSIFGPKSPQRSPCSQCNHEQPTSVDISNQRRISRRKIRNYAQFTRKFSLGNGPSKLVQSYFISTESGKMLGTLVALAVARMKNLESFLWDMPTGIIREVWEALSSLGYDSDGFLHASKLESIWIRCHDSKEFRAPSQNIHFFHSADKVSARFDLLRTSYRQVEHPNFSILPPLKSISVLQIDQIAYFEELSILISRSISRLRELRIGIAAKSELAGETVREETNPTEGTFLGESSLTPLGAHGVLGMLMSKFCDCKRQRPLITEEHRATSSQYVPFEESAANATEASLASSNTGLSNIAPGIAFDSVNPPLPASAPAGQIVHHPLQQLHSLGHRDQAITASSVFPAPRKLVVVRREQPTKDGGRKLEDEGARASKERFEKHREDAQNQLRLKLRVLAFEKVPLSITVLTKAVEWEFLVELTLLHCNSDESLWNALSKRYSPQPKASVVPSPTKSTSSHDYPLQLRKIHTDGVSNALISFLRDTLAPNTLECLFLQDRKDYKPSSKVSVDAIWKGPLRRHRNSLQKLSIDSAFKHHYSDGSWKKWILNRGVLAFITSGKMTSLRELAVSVEYKDWHFLLQHLPGLPHLRSLYIPYINEHVHAGRLDARELALQMLDIVTLRPEIELCYIGILSKCFEILEGQNAEAVATAGTGTVLPATPLISASPWNNIPFLNHEESEDSSTSSADEGEDDDEVIDIDDDDDEDAGASDSEVSSLKGSETSEDDGPQETRLRLREILFFAEKVEIFKVRHGTV